MELDCDGFSLRYECKSVYLTELEVKPTLIAIRVSFLHQFEEFLSACRFVFGYFRKLHANNNKLYSFCHFLN
jgi:hypothetical protein